jgi:hypothetical protein
MSLGLEGAGEANNRLSRFATGRADVQTGDSQMVKRSPTEGGRKEECTPLKHTRDLRAWLRTYLGGYRFWSYRFTG